MGARGRDWSLSMRISLLHSCLDKTYWKIMGLAMPIAVWTDPKPPNLAPEPQAWRGAAGRAWLVALALAGVLRFGFLWA